MSTDVKICPECDAEFFAHISECNGCHVALVSPCAPDLPEATTIPEPEDFELTEDNLRIISIEQGDIAKIDELHRALKARNIPSQVIVAKQSCNGGFILQVPEYNVKNAFAAIDDYWQKVHPELKEAATREDSGQCPACGFELNSSPESCPDCGLSLGGGTESDNNDCSEPSDSSGSCGPC
jgi:hypothetical protein